MVRLGLVNFNPAAESLVLARSARVLYLALIEEAICLCSSKPLRAASWIKTGTLFMVIWLSLVMLSMSILFATK